MAEQATLQPVTQRRRSTRITRNLPITVRGIDLLSQPFEERTSTVAFNIHGCKYPSRHHLPKNTWVTIQVADLEQQGERSCVRARVVWIHRPHTMREPFQIGVELERPGNIWGIVSPPPDWVTGLKAGVCAETDGVERPPALGEERAAAAASQESFEEPAAGMEKRPPGDAHSGPLFNELRGQLERHAAQGAKDAASPMQSKFMRTMGELDPERTMTADSFFQRWREEFERHRNEAGEQLSSEVFAELRRKIGETTQQCQNVIQSDFERLLGQARELLLDCERRSQSLRADINSADAVVDRMAQARLEMEAAEALRDRRAQTAEAHRAELETTSAGWRQRIESELAIARAQWQELLQASLDSAAQRLAAQVAETSRVVLERAEQGVAGRAAELARSTSEVLREARESLSELRASIEQELERGEASLGAMEETSRGLRETARHWESARQSGLGEFQQRLDELVTLQLAALERRAEDLATGMEARVTPALDTLCRQHVDRVASEADRVLAPRLERIATLARDLAARESQTEEGLRLYRERLRQTAENNAREAAGEMAATLATLRAGFETARKEAHARWTEELEAASARATHAAYENLLQSAEWQRQEMQARLDELVGQSLSRAASRLEDQASEAAAGLAAELDQQRTAHAQQVLLHVGEAADQVVARAQGDFERAAEAAAASFGEVLRGISQTHLTEVERTGKETLSRHRSRLAASASELRGNFEADVRSSLDLFCAQMGAQREVQLAEARKGLQSEIADAVEMFRARGAEEQKAWGEGLGHLSADAAERHRKRLDSEAEGVIQASVERMCEQGEAAIETLSRSSEEALRKTISMVFRGLSELMSRNPAEPQNPDASNSAPAASPSVVRGAQPGENRVNA